MRRYSPLKPSKGTTWSPEVRLAILRRDNFTCVGRLVGFPLRANHMGLELDHVRASHGIGMKSRSTADNGVALCGECHRWKTEHGREARPLLLAYLSTFGGSSR